MTPEEQKEYDDHNKAQHEEMQAIANLLKRASTEGLLVEVVMSAMDSYKCINQSKAEALGSACYDWDL